ncbi:MAG TPA: FecR domain-containing protein [Caulobacteraceae bacterium]|nr:FecR domain-containing protein [Caulobacteraceae bacterium]
MAPDPLENRKTPRSGAAYWLNHRRSGDMTAEDVRAFQVWLDRDPANRLAYEELERLWGALGAAADDPQIMAAREEDGRQVDRRARLRWAAIAAGIVALAGGFMAVGPDLPLQGALPAGAKPGFSQQVAHGPTEFRTSIGQRTTVTLPDRSTVTLDTDSVLRVLDSQDERLVSLEKGRAFFKVAKDHRRPFVVLAAGHRVRALGTAFDVQVGPGKFEVTLVEGRVKVETPSPRRADAVTAELRPGQRLAVVEDAPKLVQVDLRTETSWHDGRLTFVRDPLSEAVAEMNRYSDKKIVFRDGEIPDKSIIGVFRAGDVDRFAKAVEMDGLASISAETEDFIELSAN